MGPEHRRFVEAVRESQDDSRHNVILTVMASPALVECFATPLGTHAVGLPSMLHRADFSPCREVECAFVEGGSKLGDVQSLCSASCFQA